MTSLLLGMRLAATSNRLRLVVSALAIAFAVAFLLAALGAEPAHRASTARLTAREPVTTGLYGDKGAPITNITVVGSPASTWWRGRTIDIRTIAALGRGPLPPGLSRAPAPGEMAVSPELAQALAGAHGAELANRLPSRRGSLIGRAGLAGPRELYAYVGARAQDIPDGVVVTRFGGKRYTSPTPPEIRVAGALGAVGLLLPVLVLIGTATRLSAASRDRRLAAIRLVGATPWQARLLIAGESLLFGALGVLCGLAVFLGLRPVAASLVPLTSGVYASDLLPPISTLVVVLLGAPVLGCVVALASLRRLLVSPLGVRRRGRVSTASWWRLLPLVGGIALLVGAHASPDLTFGDRWTGHVPLLGGAALVLIGLALAAPTVSRGAGWALERTGKGLGSALAGRRIGADPGASGRVVTGMVLVVFVAAWLLAFLPLLEESRVDMGKGLSPTLQRGLLHPYVRTGAGTQESIRSLPGVKQVLSVEQVALTADRDSGDVLDVVSCDDLTALVHRPVDCASAAAVHITGSVTSLYLPRPLPLGRRLPVFGFHGRPAGQVSLPARLPELRLSEEELAIGLVQSEVVLIRSAVPTAALNAGYQRLAVFTDGRQDSVERVRGALPRESAFGVLTPDEERAVQDRIYRSYQKAVRLGLVLALLVGAASLAVTTADSAAERIRSTAGLVALGTPLRTLRQAALLQMLGPMLANVAVALTAAVAASWLYVDMDENASHPFTSLPWGAWGLTAIASVIAVLVATAVTLPLVNAAGRPDALRSE
jgi:hypothetical protein